MAKSPLKYHKDLDISLGITKDSDLTTDEKITYLNAQIEELKKFAYRSRVDVLLSENLIANKDPLYVQKGQQNKAEYTNNAAQAVNAIKTLTTLRDELDK